MSNKKAAIAGAASIVGSATMLSRLFGFIRDAVIAYYIGAGLYADAFFVAFRIANLFRRLVGEGALTPAIVPIFTEIVERGDKGEIKRFVGKLFTLFFLILALGLIVGLFASKYLVLLLSPGFTADPEKFAITVVLTRLLFPYMLFIGLVAMAMGILNTLRHFAAPALSPVLFNIAIIISVLVLSPLFSLPVYALVIGVLLGGLLQVLLQIPFLKKRDVLPKPNFAFNDPEIKKIFLLMGPALLGVGVYQLNIFVTTRFASALAQGSVSYLYYATRLMELPLGVFGVAVSTAVLPGLSADASKGDWSSFKDSFSFALRIVNFVTIPSCVGLIILARPIIEILFQRGEFGAQATSGTAYALFFYALGLVPVAGTRVLVSVFYSMKDTKTPVKIAVVTFVVNLLMCFLLVGPLRHGGLALATSISALVNFVILIWTFRVKSGPVGFLYILRSALKSLFGSFVMGLFLLLALSSVDWQGFALWTKAGFVMALVILGCLVYLLTVYIIKTPEIRFIKDFLAKRRSI